MLTLSEMAVPLKQSGIRLASSRCREMNGINLGQGICDIPIAEPVKEAACLAIEENKGVYSACEGVYALRQALSEKIRTFNKVDVDPEHELMVSHGATGAFVCAVKALFNPGDEVILFEPFYGYHKNILNLMDINVLSVPMSLTDFSIDMEQLASAITKKTKAIVVCTPNNPTGKVYSKAELLEIGEIACRHNLAIITDEIYEYFTYPGYQHISMASLSEELKQRTITISGFSKTFNMTGWRLGYASGPAHIIEKMSLIQDFLYVCPVTPLQHAGLTALMMKEDYYQAMQQAFLEKRQLTVNALEALGFVFSVPQGAYYILASCNNLKQSNGQQLVERLMNDAKVATVPGVAFYQTKGLGLQSVRFCYALNTDILTKAFEQISQVLST